ncbi:MATE family efflux transporter [Candidatus Njordibacter sp. Uisw_002]|jgi:putative MATE family efflux protein|uniref:MATE family efflux transporter n=1 Tax=Candidatus Njordibacter sp. Uisw_002 TaxID=3230971 RepID=UPI003D4ECBD2|tara:strand:+ start:437 stop:1849 length:1413 start_codon:yes stop_codon:yes gene_type:complete
MSKKTSNLGTKPVIGLFFGMAAPIAVGMMVHGLYNVVDAIFVTRVIGVDAMGGISIVFPIQMFIFALATLVGSGMASIVARQLGAKQDDKANTTIDMAFRLGLSLAIVITVGIYLNINSLLHFLGVSDALWPYAYDYLMPLVLLSFPIVLVSSIPSDLLRAEGKAMLMMIGMVSSAVLNIILDAVFIFVLEMGVEGVAYATILSQIFAAMVMLYFILGGKTQLKLRPFAYKMDWPILKDITVLGIPILISHAGVSLFIGLTNYSVTQFSEVNSDLYVSAYGLIGRLMIFFILPAIAMTISFQTIAGYNYGAKHYDRVLETIKVGVTASLCYGLGVSAIMLFIPHQIIGIFTQDQALLATTAGIAFWSFLLFPLSNAHSVISSLFQALGKARQAIFLSSLRIYLLLIPALLILPKIYGIEGIWYSFPLADAIAFAVVVYFVFRERSNLIGLNLASKAHAQADQTNQTQKLA